MCLEQFFLFNPALQGNKLLDKSLHSPWHFSLPKTPRSVSKRPRPLKANTDPVIRPKMMSQTSPSSYNKDDSLHSANTSRNSYESHVGESPLARKGAEIATLVRSEDDDSEYGPDEIEIEVNHP